MNAEDLADKKKTQLAIWWDSHSKSNEKEAKNNVSIKKQQNYACQDR